MELEDDVAGAQHPGQQLEAEVKYAFLRSHWGQGLASEAVPALLAYGAKEHGLQHIIATVASGNAASQRVLSKAGMSLVEERKHAQGVTLVYE
ncbi:MAG: GNAT family N-acetyltransferase, partial [Candidatus Poseidoniia archaeon]